MKGEGKFTRDGVEYETRWCAGDALAYKVRFNERDGWCPFADEEERQAFIDKWFARNGAEALRARVAALEAAYLELLAEWEHDEITIMGEVSGNFAETRKQIAADKAKWLSRAALAATDADAKGA